MPVPNGVRPDAGAPFASFVTTSRDLIVLLRDLLLLILAFFLIFRPAAVNSLLVNAGFKEGSIAGFTWEANLKGSDEALKQARATISNLQTKNDELVRTLSELKAKSADSGLKDRIGSLEQTTARLKIESQSVQSSVAQRIRTNAYLLEKVPPR
jgi:hypothetical protein